MLLKKAKQSKKEKMNEISCDNISVNMMIEIANLAPSSFFVLIYGVDRKSRLNDILTDSGQQYVSQITTQEKYKIVLNTNKIFFDEIVPLLDKMKFVTVYFPFGTVTFEQFIYNCVHGNEYLFEKYKNTIDQKGAIKKELCYLTCTWDVEECRIRFYFDNFQGVEMFKKLEMLWDGE